eukprot:COSAG05_NODE_407_length_10145_cov_234.042604_9_plen_98_part_00
MTGLLLCPDIIQSLALAAIDGWMGTRELEHHLARDGFEAKLRDLSGALRDLDAGQARARRPEHDGHLCCIAPFHCCVNDPFCLLHHSINEKEGGQYV